MYVEKLLTSVAIWSQIDLLPVCHRVGDSTTGEYSFPKRGRKEYVVFQRITHTQSTALAAFYTFVRTIGTSEWITGIETSPRVQNGNFWKREITILQGNPRKDHQKVTFRFSNYTETGEWLIYETIFSGNFRGGWAKTFKTTLLPDFTHIFVPEGMDSRDFKELSKEEKEEAMHGRPPPNGNPYRLTSAQT